MNALRSSIAASTLSSPPIGKPPSSCSYTFICAACIFLVKFPKILTFDVCDVSFDRWLFWFRLPEVRRYWCTNTALEWSKPSTVLWGELWFTYIHQSKLFWVYRMPRHLSAVYGKQKFKKPNFRIFDFNRLDQAINESIQAGFCEINWINIMKRMSIYYQSSW